MRLSAGLCPPLRRPWGRIVPPWRPPPMATGQRSPSGARASCPPRAAETAALPCDLLAGRAFWPTSSMAKSLGPTRAGLPPRWRRAPMEGEVLVVHLAPARPSPPAPLPKGEGRLEAALPTVAQSLRFCSRPSPPCAAARASNDGSAASRPLGKSPASGTRSARSNRCWCKWPRRPRGCWGRIGPASFSGTGRTTRLVGRPALGIPEGELRFARRPRRGGRSDPQRPAPPPGRRRRARGRRPQRRCATPLSNPHAAVRSAARPFGRTVRRVRVDQQAVGHVQQGGRRGVGRVGRPCGRGPGKRPRPPAVA